MSKLNRFVLALLIAGPVVAFARFETSPTPFRRFCEQALISTGLYHPEIRATIVDEGYKAEPIEKGLFISVQLPEQTKKSIYTYTNRNAYELRRQMIYPAQFLDPKLLQGLKIVDLACGEGDLVEDLRREGVDAIGLDVHLGAYQKSKGYFVQASMDRTPFEDKSVDILMSSMGPIRYNLHDRALILKLLNEAHRILKPGGVFRISPLELDDLIPPEPGKGSGADGETHYQKVQVLFAVTGANPEVDLRSTGLWPLPSGWRIKSHPGNNWFNQPSMDIETRGPYYWIELERLD